MKQPILSLCLCAALLAGCESLKKDADKNRKPGPYETNQPPVPTKDQGGDVAFQSFVGRLHTAVQRRDVATIAAMMTPDFGYTWNEGPAGGGVFPYWDRNNLWPVLEKLTAQRWVPYDGYMVVPAQLANDPNYNGFRAGVQQIGGSWRFAYFVPAPPAEEKPARQPEAAPEPVEGALPPLP